MSLASKIKIIVETLYPDANFILASQFSADYESFFKDSNVLIVLNNQLNIDDTIGQNVNLISREKIQISIYLKDKAEQIGAEADAYSQILVEQATGISRKIYLNIWLLPEVNLQDSDGRVTHSPFFKEFNSIRTGVLSLANWSVNQQVSCS